MTELLEVSHVEIVLLLPMGIANNFLLKEVRSMH